MSKGKFYKICRYFNEICISKFLSDKKAIKKQYYKTFKKKLDLSNPKSFNEKLQWLKLYDRKDIYTTMVDKYDAKKYVASIIGEEYIIPTLGIYDKFSDIDFNKLPEQFVIKCTHDSGGLAICKNKKDFDFKKNKFKFNMIMKRNFYYRNREWPYKNVKPRIIVEKYMENKNENNIRDYKFLCFDGEPKILYISDDSHTANQKICFFDMNYKQLDIKRYDYGDYDILPEKPKNFEKMKELASILSKNMAHLRVDFYEIDGKVYFGELTFYTGSGLIPFEKEEWDYKLGELIDLKKVIVNEK